MAAKKKRKLKKSDPERQAKLDKAYQLLLKVRASKTVKLKLPSTIRPEFKALDGSMQSFRLRYYQVQASYHMLVLKRMILGEDAGLGKTIETLVGLAHMLQKNPSAKVIIITPKSTVHQWASEIRRFTTGIKPLVAETKTKSKKHGSPLDQRKAIYKQWLDAKPEDESAVLIMNYAIMVRDWDVESVRPVDKKGKPDPKKPVVPGVLDQATQTVAKDGNLIVVFDEAQQFKNMRTKTWEKARFLSDQADRVYALTATLLKSNLIEGYCIFKVIKPELFGGKTKFMDNYCHVRLETVPGSSRKIPVILGYKNLAHFRKKIDPFFLGRKKHEVSDELPVLVTKEITCELSAAENAKYSEALSGVFELGNGEIKDFEEHRILVSLIYCQEVVNSLTMLEFKEGDEIGEDVSLEDFTTKTIKVGKLGAKEQGLVDLLEGELEDEKVIIYTRFASLVPRLQKILERIKVKSLRITGKENDKARKKAQAAFQDSDSDVKVIFITDAGGVGINLQMAKAMIFFDQPWTWGDFVQTLGRMIRIGSPHRGVMVYHMMAERPFETGSRKTIDHHVLSLLRKKKALIEQILGEEAKGSLTFDTSNKPTKDLFDNLLADARGVKKKA